MNKSKLEPKRRRQLETRGAPGLPVDWELIEKTCIAGLSFKDAGERFGIKPGTIAKRAARQGWPTPSAVALRMREIERKKGDTAAQIVAEDWTEKGETHRRVAFDLAHESLKKMKPRAPRNFREADAADRMARRASGLEQDSIVNQTLIQVNEAIEGHDNEPIEAEIVSPAALPASA